MGVFREVSKFFAFVLGLLQDFVTAIMVAVLIQGYLPQPQYWLIALGVIILVLITISHGRGLLRIVSRAIFPLVLALVMVIIYYRVHQLGVVALYGFEFDVPKALLSVKFQPDYKEPFYSALSTLYAIVVALALVKGIEGVDHIRKVIADETVRLRTIWNNLSYFEFEDGDNRRVAIANAEQRAHLRAILMAYAVNTSKGLGSKSDAENDDLIRAGRQHLRKITPLDDDDRVAYQATLNAYEDLILSRTLRRDVNHNRLPLYLIFALWFMSFALIMPFLAEPLCVNKQNASSSSVTIQADTTFGTAKNYGINEQGIEEQVWGKCPRGLSPSGNRYSQFFMIFVMTAFFSFMMLMLSDISKVDKGFWRVDASAFKAMVAELKESYKRDWEEESKQYSDRGEDALSQEIAAIYDDQLRKFGLGEISA